MAVFVVVKRCTAAYLTLTLENELLAGSRVQIIWVTASPHPPVSVPSCVCLFCQAFPGLYDDVDSE